MDNSVSAAELGMQGCWPGYILAQPTTSAVCSNTLCCPLRLLHASAAAAHAPDDPCRCLTAAKVDDLDLPRLHILEQHLRWQASQHRSVSAEEHRLSVRSLAGTLPALSCLPATHVLGLEVAMDDARGAQHRQSIQHLQQTGMQ